MKDKKETNMVAVVLGVILAIPFLLTGFLLLGLVTLLIDGLLFSKMWEWWIVTTFNASKLTLIQAMAISTIIAYFRNHHYLQTTKEGLGAFAKRMAYGLIGDFLLFGISYILLFFK